MGAEGGEGVRRQSQTAQDSPVLSVLLNLGGDNDTSLGTALQIDWMQQGTCKGAGVQDDPNGRRRERSAGRKRHPSYFQIPGSIKISALTDSRVDHTGPPSLQHKRNCSDRHPRVDHHRRLHDRRGRPS